MRRGQNPAKMGLQAYQPSQLGILLVVYIPMQNGYFIDSLEILKYQVASIHKNTSEEFNLHVFDNGSCQEVRDALFSLLADGWIDWLTLSQHNLGKAGVLNWAFRGMPNEIICYSDGDVYFRPRWYEASLRLLKTFPEAGMVTGQPCFFDSLGGKGSAHIALCEQKDFELSTRLADASIAEEYVHSIGDKPELLAKYSKHLWDVVCNRTTGIEAVIGSSPFQFLGYKAKLERILPLPNVHGLNKDDDAQIIVRMDKLGLLQLSTLDSYVYHMGNRVDETTVKEIHRDKLPELLQENRTQRAAPAHGEINLIKKQVFGVLDIWAHLPVIKSLLRRIYNLLFEYYAKKN